MKIYRAYLKAMWEFMEWLSDLFTHVAGWYRDRYQKLTENPLRGRMVRWIRTTGDMAQDMPDHTEVGVVIRLYSDRLVEAGVQPFIVVRLESGECHSLPLRAFYQNPDDGVLEYRY